MRGKVFLLCLSSVSSSDFFCPYFGWKPAVLTLFCVFAGNDAGNCLALGSIDAVASGLGVAGCRALGWGAVPAILLGGWLLGWCGWLGGWHFWQRGYGAHTASPSFGFRRILSCCRYCCVALLLFTLLLLKRLPHTVADELPKFNLFFRTGYFIDTHDYSLSFI